MGFKVNKGMFNTSLRAKEWWSPNDKSKIAIAQAIFSKLSEEDEKRVVIKFQRGKLV